MCVLLATSTNKFPSLHQFICIVLCGKPPFLNTYWNTVILQGVHGLSASEKFSLDWWVWPDYRQNRRLVMCVTVNAPHPTLLLSDSLLFESCWMVRCVNQQHIEVLKLRSVRLNFNTFTYNQRWLNGESLNSVNRINHLTWTCEVSFNPPLPLGVCLQEFRGALSVHVGGTTSRVRSVHSGSVPASRPSGSVTETTTAGTIATRTDAVSFTQLLSFYPLFSFSPSHSDLP